MMDNLPQIFFSLREDWRMWLDENHDKSKGVWLQFFKLTAKKPTLTYNEAVEEALCFGWIDGTVKNLDEERYVRKIMPRTNFFNWSPTNRKRVEMLIASGLMTKNGLLKIGNYSKSEKLVWPENREQTTILEFSPEMIDLIRQNHIAFTNFKNLLPSQQKRYKQ